MKKNLFLLVSFVVFSTIFVGCGTTSAVKGSGIKGESATVKKVQKEIIDYQGATFGTEIPQWGVEVATGNKTEQH